MNLGDLDHLLSNHCSRNLRKRLARAPLPHVPDPALCSVCCCLDHSFPALVDRHTDLILKDTLPVADHFYLLPL